MPRVISDELYNQLMGCVKQQRLLGVMGMLERMQEEAKFVVQQEDFKADLPNGLARFTIYSGWGEFNAKDTANKD